MCREAADSWAVSGCHGRRDGNIACHSIQLFSYPDYIGTLLLLLARII